ncbi:hypothetical protein S7335_1894 [Synechococcus sp. PCC 7335]|nr:hypothetical protein S7335_1894 [Synechococcus sp. PCC 7335]
MSSNFHLTAYLKAVASYEVLSGSIFFEDQHLLDKDLIG